MPAQSDECLMLLSRVGKCVRGGESRVFRCKTCLKEFSSFQALGGHRASHTKPASDDKSSLSPGSLTKNKKVKAPTPHLCPICGLEFPMGQALGGHMRKHRTNKASEGALVTHSFLPEDAVVTSSGNTTASLDFGLDSMDSLVNLNLELGRTIY